MGSLDGRCSLYGHVWACMSFPLTQQWVSRSWLRKHHRRPTQDTPSESRWHLKKIFPLTNIFATISWFSAKPSTDVVGRSINLKCKEQRKQASVNCASNRWRAWLHLTAPSSKACTSATHLREFHLLCQQPWWLWESCSNNCLMYTYLSANLC